MSAASTSAPCVFSVRSDGDANAFCELVRASVRPAVKAATVEAIAQGGIRVFLQSLTLSDAPPRALGIRASEWMCTEAYATEHDFAVVGALAEAARGARASNYVTATLFGCTADGYSVTVAWQHAWRPWVLLEVIGACGAPKELAEALTHWLWGTPPHEAEDEPWKKKKKPSAWPSWRFVRATPVSARHTYGIKASLAPGSTKPPMGTFWKVDVPTLADAGALNRLFTGGGDGRFEDRTDPRLRALHASLRSLRLVESLVRWEAKFTLDAGLRPCRWVDVDRPALSGLSRGGSVARFAHTQLELTVASPPAELKAFSMRPAPPPIRLAAEQGDAIPPLLHASFDGEMFSHTKKMPSPLAGDYLGALCVTFKRYGAGKHDIVRVGIVLEPHTPLLFPPDTPPHCLIATAATPRMVADLFAAVVRASDPDELKGYNTSGFDNPFLWYDAEQAALPLEARGSEASAMLLRASALAADKARAFPESSASSAPPAPPWEPTGVLLARLRALPKNGRAYDGAARAARWLGSAAAQPREYNRGRAWGHMCASEGNRRSKKYAAATRARAKTQSDGGGSRLKTLLAAAPRATATATATAAATSSKAPAPAAAPLAPMDGAAPPDHEAGSDHLELEYDSEDSGKDVPQEQEDEQARWAAEEVAASFSDIVLPTNASAASFELPESAAAQMRASLRRELGLAEENLQINVLRAVAGPDNDAFWSAVEARAGLGSGAVRLFRTAPRVPPPAKSLFYSIRYWGRLAAAESGFYIKRAAAAAKGDRTMYTIEASGRLQADQMYVVMDEVKRTDYTMAAIAREFLGAEEGKIHMTPDEIFEAIRTRDGAQLGAMTVYCLRDCDVVHWLADRFRCMANWVSMARVTSTWLNDVVNSGQQARVFNMICDYARRQGFVIARRPSGWPSSVTPPSMPWATACSLLATLSVKPEAPLFESFGTRKADYKGATVLPPKRGLYPASRPVACIDFASLYPSIIIALNLCFSTLLVGSDAEIAATVAYLTEHGVPPTEHELEVLVGGVYAKKKVYFVTHVQGLLPLLLSDLLAARAVSKREMKAAAKAGDAVGAELGDAKQAAQKVTANSVYGSTGVEEGKGKYSCRALAASVTGVARRLLGIAKGVAEDHGGDVVYGDTDSVMFHFVAPPAASRRDAATRGAAVAKAINDKLSSSAFFSTFSVAGGGAVDMTRMAAGMEDDDAADCASVGSGFLGSQSSACSGGGGSASLVSAAASKSAAERAIRKRNVDMAQSALKIVLEKLMGPFLLLGPKRYIARKYEGDFLTDGTDAPITPDMAEKKVLIKGYNAVRRDTTWHLRTVSEAVIAAIARSDDEGGEAATLAARDKVRAAIAGHIDAMVRGDFALETYVQTKQLREDYEGTPPLHAAALERAAARGDPALPTFGSRVRYVITLPPGATCGGLKARWRPSPAAADEELKMFQRSEMPLAVERGLVPLDVRYYIASMRSPLAPLLGALGFSDAELSALFDAAEEAADAKALGRPPPRHAPSIRGFIGAARPAATAVATAAAAPIRKRTIQELLAAARVDAKKARVAM